ncbi:hypothetical protein [Breoghania sp.]|nr:hypothetical protein [Breoghania sp.]MDJ0933206.1 hypothetical protein [Breoghania sp.]
MGKEVVKPNVIVVPLHSAFERVRLSEIVARSQTSFVAASALTASA